MKPPKPITDPTFKYYSSANTSVARTWARIRRERAQEAERQRVADEQEAAGKVCQLKKGKA
jgi:hypothetical protein